MRHNRPVPRLLGSAVSCVLLCGCSDRRDPTTESPTLASETGDVAVVGPQILDAGGEALRIGTDRRHDLELLVVGVTPTTRILRDGQDLAPSVHPPTATLTHDRLTLHFAGAMVPGAHTVLLQSADATLVSDRVRIDVEVRERPPLKVEFPSAVLGPATTLVPGALDRGDALGLLERDEGGARLHVYAPRDEGWRHDAVTFELPAAWNADHAPALTMSADPPAPLVAWIEGHPPDALAWVVPGASVRRLPLLDELPREYEFAQLGAARFVGEHLLVEQEVYRDVEAPRPGDRRLVELPARDGTLGLARPLAALATADAWQPRGVVDVGGWRWLGRAVALVHRSAGTPALLRFGADAPASLPMGSARPELAPMHVGAMVIGTFESRIMVVSTPSSPEWWLVMDDLSSGAVPPPQALGVPLDEAPEVVATQLRGVPIFLFPRGANRSVLAVVADRATAVPIELEALGCDELVVRTDVVVDEHGRAALACRRGDAVLLGALTLPAGPLRNQE